MPLKEWYFPAPATSAMAQRRTHRTWTWTGPRGLRAKLWATMATFVLMAIKKGAKYGKNHGLGVPNSET